jgi:hypothetical protein
MQVAEEPTENMSGLVRARITASVIDGSAHVAVAGIAVAGVAVAGITVAVARIAAPIAVPATIVVANAAAAVVVEQATQMTAGRSAGLLDALGDPFRDALHRGDRFTDAAGNRFVAGFGHVLVARHADLLHAALLDAACHLAANLPVASFADLTADLVAAFLAVLLADLVVDLAAVDVALLFIHRFAHGVAAFLLAATRHFAADAALDFLDAGLHTRFHARASDVFPALPRHLAATFFHDVAALGDLAFAETGLALFSPTRFLHFAVDRFADGLVARYPTFFQHVVIHEFVANSILLLTRGKAALGVTVGIPKIGEPTGTAAGRRRGLDQPQ